MDGPPLLDLFSPEYPQFAVWKSRAQEDPYLVLRMARQLCWPIAHLHSYRFFHFDIAPKNIFVREVGQKPHMILGDLGVGQTVPGLDDPSLKTMLGIFVGGTREYTPAILHEYLNFKEKKLAPAPLLAKYAQFWDVFAIATVLEDMIKAWDLSEHRDLVATKILCKRAKNFEEGFDALRLTNELERLLPAQVLTAGVEELSSDAVGKRTNVAIPLYSVSLSDRVEQIVQSTRLFSTTAAAESDEDILRAIAGVEWDIAVGPLHTFYDACGRISRYFATLLFLWHSLPVVDRGERQIYFDHAIRGRAAFQQHYLTCPRCLLADEKDGIIASGATS